MQINFYPIRATYTLNRGASGIAAHVQIQKLPAVVEFTL